MAYDYDALYATTPNALGDQTRAFADFFAGFDRTGVRVLDVGCGQGRDALNIARAGHRVVAVDLSPAGIAQLCHVADAEGLAIEGIVADLEDYQPEGAFDVIVIDRTLHMLEAAARLRVLARLVDHLAPEGWILIADERSNMAAFKGVLDGSGRVWRRALDKGGLLFVQSTADGGAPSEPVAHGKPQHREHE